MRVITRRRVKVRVTVKRSDGTTVTQAWNYHRKREPTEENQGEPRQSKSAESEVDINETSNADNKTVELTYRSFDDVFDTYEDNGDNNRVLINERFRRSMPSSLSAMNLNPADEKIDFQKSNYLELNDDNFSPDDNGNFSKDSSSNRIDNYYDRLNSRRNPRSLFRTRNVPEPRSQSLPRHCLYQSHPCDKYLDSELSTSYESEIDSIGKQIPSKYTKEKKVTFAKSLESIYEDPSETFQLYKSPDKHMTKSLSEDIWRSDDVDCSTIPWRRKSGAIPKIRQTNRESRSNREFEERTLQENTTNNNTLAIKLHRTVSQRLSGDDIHSLENKDPNAIPKIHEVTYRTEPNKFTAGSSWSGISNANENISDCGAFVLKKSKSTTALPSDDCIDYDDRRITRNASFTVSCDDLRGICKENKYIIKNRINGDEDNNCSVFNERITFDRFPQHRLQSEEDPTVEESSNIPYDPDWINERVSHTTTNGALNTENVSTHVKSGTKIETRTCIKFCDSPETIQQISQSSRSGLVRASSETIITLKKGQYNDFYLNFPANLIS